MSVLKRITAIFALPIVLILLWWLGSAQSTSPFIPRPENLLGDLRDVWLGSLFLEQVVPSLGRLALGLLFAIVVGAVLGVLVGSSMYLRKFTGPLLEFIRAVPPPVLLPVLMMLMGIDDRAKVFLIALGCVWPILLNTVDGVRSVDRVLSHTTRTYGITGLSRFRYFILPASMPRIMTGIRLALPIGIILMVVSEMYAASDGLGFSIMYFQRTFQNGPMWAGVVILGLIGVLLAFLFKIIEQRVIDWYYAQRKVDSSA